MEKGFCTWFTGVPASGKSTVGKGVLNKLREMGIKIEDFDADEVRSHISPNLGYTLEARDENTKRLAFFASILTRNGISANIAEVMVDCPLEECQKRDPKGLYQKAAEGKINDIAGMHQPFEAPEKPEVYLDTSKMSVDECVDAVIEKLRELKYIPSAAGTDDKTGYSKNEEEKVKKRLENLGYM